MSDKLWNLLGTEQGLLLGGFVLTTVAGTVIAYVFQLLAWRRETRLSLYQQKYRDGVELLSQLSTMIDTRFFALQRLAWALQEQNEAGITVREREYFETIVYWNQHLRATHNGIRLLVGDKDALDFLDYADDERPEQPRSLHYQFVAAHRVVMKGKAGVQEVKHAAAIVERLNWSLSNYISGITTEFHSRAESLSLLKVPAAGSRDARFLPSRPTT